jgi:hypothetical protein
MNEYSIEEIALDDYSKFNRVRYSIKAVVHRLHKLWFDVFVDLIDSNAHKSYEFLGDTYTFRDLEEFIRSEDGLDADPRSLYTAIQFVKIFAEEGVININPVSINRLLIRFNECGLNLNSNQIPNVSNIPYTPDELEYPSNYKNRSFLQIGAKISKDFSNLWFENFINTIDSGWYKSYEFLGDIYRFESLEDFIRSEDGLNTNPNTLYSFILACTAYPETANAAKQLLLKFDECRFNP